MPLLLKPTVSILAGILERDVAFSLHAFNRVVIFPVAEEDLAKV